jgi:Methyltransferase domain
MTRPKGGIVTRPKDLIVSFFQAGAWLALEHENMTSTAGILTGKATPARPAHTVEATYLEANSFAYRCRVRRFEMLRPLIDAIIARRGSCRIADIGGTEYYWRIASGFLDRAPVEIHLINLEEPAVRGAKFTSHAGDATTLAGFADNSFDLVHSNSVIEHVGNWRQMSAMAANVRRLAPSYFVQTPNYWFPIEPHYRFAGFQWLPEPVRANLLMRFNLGFGGRRPDLDAAMRAVQSSSLLTAGQMQFLFPDATLMRERIGPLTKSLIMVRDGS